MERFILHGNLISAPHLGALEITQQGYLVVEDGKIQGVFPTLRALSERYQTQNTPVLDFGDALILQSCSDLHLHAPQYPMLGTGMDLPLLDWLNTYTFPTEARFADLDYARQIYRALAQDLIRNGTTRVCMFSSLHTDATWILMDELQRAGVTGYVGKVNMDCNGSPDLQETTEESKRETLRWLDGCQDFSLVKPILTPRFIPSCSNDLLKFLGELADKYDLPIQSHLSENLQEIEWVRRLHPDCRQYWEAYQKFGLWNDRTLMAHCVWSDSEEQAAIRDSGVTAVHCPDSNQNLCSGVAPVRTFLDRGISIALGSDLAAGDHLSMFDVAASAIRVSKARRILDRWDSDFLTVPEAWYLATSAGAEWFGDKPGFAVGNRLHALVLRDDQLPGTASMTVRERFERSLYVRQENAIQAVWSDGQRRF